MARTRPAGATTGSTSSSSGPSSGASQGRRLLRGVDRVFRVIGAPALAMFLFVGALTGLRQQSLDLPADDIDCDYRAELIERRIHALQAYRPQQHFFFPDHDSLTPLLDQSLAACASAHSPTTPQLERLKDALTRWERARRELQAADRPTGPPTD